MSPPLEYLVEPKMMASGRIHLLGGSPFAGKSTLMAQIIRAFLGGDTLFGMQFKAQQPEEMGIIFTDRPWSDNDIWLKRLGVDTVPHYSLADDPTAKAKMIEKASPETSGVELFEYCLLKLPRTVKNVFVDVFTTAFVGRNLYDQGLVHKHMIQLLHICKEHELNIVGTCYGNKQKAGQAENYARPVDRIMGAAPLRGSASTLMFLTAMGEEKEQRYQQFVWASRHHETKVINVVRDTDGLFTVWNGPGADEIGRCVIVLDFIPNEGIARPALRDLLVKAQVSRASAYRYIEDVLSLHWAVEDDTGLIRKVDKTDPS